MINPHSLIRTYLTGAMSATVGSRIYAGRDEPPAGYTPSSGKAVVFKSRNIDPDYDDALFVFDGQFKCYGTSEVDADICYRALYTALHNATSSTILHAEATGGGVPLEDPDTGWFYVLAYFMVMLRGG